MVLQELNPKKRPRQYLITLAALLHKKRLIELRKDVEMSRYYEDARRLAKNSQNGVKGLTAKKSRYIITSGGGGGIMEAANREQKKQMEFPLD